MESAERRILVLLMVLALLRGLLFAAIVPPFQAPDEPAHAAYIESLAIGHRLPSAEDTLPPIVKGSVERSKWWNELTMAGRFKGSHVITVSSSTHPPLYYAMAAPVFAIFYRFGDIWIFAIRSLGALFSAFVVWFGYKTGRLIFPKDIRPACVTGALLALLPQPGFIMASINNDSLLILLAAAIVYLLVRFLQQPDAKIVALISLVLAAGLLTKASFVIFVPVAVAAVIVSAIGRETNLREMLMLFAAALLPMVLISGWWYLGNLFSTDSILGLAVSQNTQAAGFWGTAFKYAFMEKTFAQFWGFFGWLTLPMNYKWYIAALIAIAASGVGYLRYFIGIRQGKAKISTFHAKIGVLFTLLVIANYAAIVQFDLATAGGAQGRYLFTSLLPVMILLSGGLYNLVADRWGKQFVLALSGGALVFTVTAAALYIIPFYYG